jgi:hypothetical protein
MIVRLRGQYGLIGGTGKSSKTPVTPRDAGRHPEIRERLLGRGVLRVPTVCLRATVLVRGGSTALRVA